MATRSETTQHNIKLTRNITPAARTNALLITGDMLTLLAFAYIGQREHETVNSARPLLGVVWTGLPFALTWLAAGWLLGAFDGKGRAMRPFLGRSLNTWLVAAPLGLLLRSYLLQRAVIPTVFVTAALGFGGAMILGWRLLFALWQRRNVKRDE
jgi:Na+-driven multidrug efflux pump